MENTNPNQPLQPFNITLDRILEMSPCCFEVWWLGLTQSQKLYVAKLMRNELVDRRAKSQVQIPDFLNVRNGWRSGVVGIPSVLEGDK